MTYCEYFNLLESKDHLIKKLDITEEQKQKLINFFKKYPNFESKIDWNRKNLGWRDFESLLASEGKSKSQTKKKGLEGLGEKEDYIVLEKTPEFTAYIPLTYLGSKIIASNAVPPVKGSGAKWCTAYQKTSEYWDNYTDKDIRFIYVCTGDTKYALVLYPSGTRQCFSFEDKYISCPEELDYLYDLYWEKENEIQIEKYIKNGVVVRESDGSISLGSSEDTWMFKAEHFVKSGRFTVKFNNWPKRFDCSYCKLTSLEGSPEEVEGDFLCSSNLISSLKGAPRKVKGSFSCYSNPNLESLEGAPEEVGKNFYCVDCKITSLKGAPRRVEGDFFCNANNLTSLLGSPKEVGKSFSCDENQLTTLKGAPESIHGYFSCGSNNLKNLKGSPRIVRDDFFCSDNQLTSLEGAPEFVLGNFNCSHNKLSSLKGIGKVVEDIRCGENLLPEKELLKTIF